MIQNIDSAIGEIVKRRDFITGLGLASLLPLQPALAQNRKQVLRDSEVLGIPRIFAEEREERREYDLSVPKAVVWHTAPYQLTSPLKTINRTVGFVEAAADTSKILYISGFLLRKDFPDVDDAGFYLYFRTTLSYLSLPRKLQGRSAIQERYAFAELGTERPAIGIDAGLVSIDYREFKLTENGKTYSPKKLVHQPLTADGAIANVRPFLKTIDKPSLCPGRNINRNYFEISEILHFDIDHRPVNFKLELPAMIINGTRAPLPTCYFEPFNIVTNDWA